MAPRKVSEKPADRGPSGTGHDTAHPEDTCQECGGPNVVWFAPNDLWKRVMRGGDRGAPDAVGIVCPVCFILRAEALGFKPTGWSVQEEIIPPDPPVAVPGPDPDCPACDAFGPTNRAEMCQCGHPSSDHKLADQAGRPCKHKDGNCLCPKFRAVLAGEEDAANG